MPSHHRIGKILTYFQRRLVGDHLPVFSAERFPVVGILEVNVIAGRLFAGLKREFRVGGQKIFLVR